MSKGFNSNRYTLDFMNEIFPELKDSEDDRIRKVLVEHFDGLHSSTYPYKGFTKEEILAWLEKQGREKPADKVEPKFKVGDWVVSPNGVYWHIDSIQNGRYEVTADTGLCDNWPLDTNIYRLWAIQDAKDGDVLVDEDNNIGIYKEIEGICWHSYIYLGCDNRLYCSNIGGYHKQNSTKPATKEQRDNLFKKINEGGYVWYPNSKSLYKLIRIHYD